MGHGAYQDFAKNHNCLALTALKVKPIVGNIITRLPYYLWQHCERRKKMVRKRRNKESKVNDIEVIELVS